MKKIRAMLVFIICTMCLTGCVRFNTSITIKSNGKADVSMLMAMVDTSEYGYDEQSLMSDEERQEYIDQGWEVEDYSKDGFNGYILSKKDVALSELSESMKNTQQDISSDSGDLSFSKQGFKYVIDWQVFDKEEGEQISAYKSYFNMTGGYMKMSITLPVKPSSHNATSVSADGKTLEWDLLNLGSDQNIHLEFSLINIGLIVAICLIAFLVIIGIIVAVVIANKKKKDRLMAPNGIQPQMMNNQYQQPIQMPQYSQQAPTMQNPQPSDAGNLVADELGKLKKLLDDGVITQEEFESQKTKLLGSDK